MNPIETPLRSSLKSIESIRFLVKTHLFAWSTRFLLALHEVSEDVALENFQSEAVPPTEFWGLTGAPPGQHTKSYGESACVVGKSVNQQTSWPWF